MQNKDYPKLRECPFCGELPIQFVKDGLTQIRCNNTQCWIEPATSFYTKPETAMEAWEDREYPTKSQNSLERHGMWILIGSNSRNFETSIEEKCSMCGRYVYRYDTQPKDAYCPSCGAKMDLEDET